MKVAGASDQQQQTALDHILLWITCIMEKDFGNFFLCLPTKTRYLKHMYDLGIFLFHSFYYYFVTYYPPTSTAKGRAELLVPLPLGGLPVI